MRASCYTARVPKPYQMEFQRRLHTAGGSPAFLPTGTPRRIHGLLSHNTMLMTVSGRETGRQVTSPVNCLRRGMTF